jgi:hypothetical protein
MGSQSWEPAQSKLAQLSRLLDTAARSAAPHGFDQFLRLQYDRLERDGGIKIPRTHQRLPVTPEHRERPQCKNCNHPERSHQAAGGCTRCKGCRKYVDPSQRRKRGRPRMCRCTHSSIEHVADEGACTNRHCSCQIFRPLVVPSTEGPGSSVRSVPTGAFESNRRRH